MIRSKTILTTRALYLLVVAVAAAVTAGCNGSDLEQLTTVYTINSDFNPDTQVLVEGSDEGINIPISVSRAEGFLSTLTLTAGGAEQRDVENVTSAFSNDTLVPGSDQSMLNLKLGIGNKPIQSGERTFILTASDGSNVQQIMFTTKIQATDAPDVYLLIGQSNMVGFGGDGDKEAGPGQADEPNDRIKQLNVSENNEENIFTTAASYIQTARIAVAPFIVRAEDPLHIPLDLNSMAKPQDYIGLGLTFAKTALLDTESEIVLVPAAWSASAFCASSVLQGNWNAAPSTNNSLGNTLLFDRAVARTNLALSETGGILRGILWHQGENDGDGAFPDCVNSYQQNLINLVTGLREEIQPDARGSAARGADADIPFIVGTMSRGFDNQSDLSQFSDEKTIIDQVHRSINTLVPYANVANFDDLTPANGFPCGNDSCIHFGSAAYRNMGRRYYQTLLRAASGN